MLLQISFIFLSTAVIPSSAHPASLGFPHGRDLSTVGQDGSLPQNASLFQNVVQICGTRGPSDELRQAHWGFLEQSRQSAKPRQASSPISVSTYMHFVSTTDQATYYPSSVRTAMITNQVSVLNSLYRPAGITFHLISTTFTINNAWATDAASTAMKQALRRGSYEVLNIYFQTNLSTAPYTYSAASTLLGYCTLPTVITYSDDDGGVTEYPTADYAADGCNVLAGSMPKAPFPAQGYNLGKTAVHEVGHWFGLLHTFQDNTCAPTDPGDYCDDTPQESQATTGCPTGKDSCPDDSGLDPINNYMDYSTDACYSRFSPDQLSRMRNMFDMFRLGY